MLSLRISELVVAVGRLFLDGMQRI